MATGTTTATATSTSRVTPQGGILEGGNPSDYDSKNPLVLFIIQVAMLPTGNQQVLTRTRP